jgi:ABC-type transport system involved in multi-copper enzyme maturation permease subunit
MTATSVAATRVSSSAGAWAARRRATLAILRRDVRSLLLAPGGYVALTLGLAAAVLVVRNHLEAIARTRLLIMSDAFTLPFFAAALVLIFFLALHAATGVAREREQGTLQVLFYGPVDGWAYLLGKHLALTAGFVVFGAGLLALLAALAAVSGLRLGGALPAAALLSVPAAAAMVAGGLLCSTLARGVRAGVALLLVISLALVALWVGSSVLGDLAAGAGGPLRWLRDVVIGLDVAAGYLSPVATLDRGIDAAVRQDWQAYAGAVAVLLAQGAALLAAAWAVFERRGVRR